ncbi:hypothetical protein CY34DRAFT_798172 [Suillus luteus UH-Slu-Lm8-n1]|uniref:Unplaced genomic scaffold CY34scaffold_7, whole genome shotgun sequence n=1 Tax=Suillus luteus UH-Slu-Lm8-n1 TaxID=930992 RepID=A0A0D0ADN9_9AGAM|nr:hypothetical protein CY34DRAFT_798172 [Suillus luteus UH-Slu-Lm8-n1]
MLDSVKGCAYHQSVCWSNRPLTLVAAGARFDRSRYPPYEPQAVIKSSGKHLDGGLSER